MGKNPKVLIGLALILALAVLGFVWTESVLVGVGIAVVGVLATIVILRRIAEGGGARRRDRIEFLEAPGSDATGPQGLATWTPQESLPTWTPTAGSGTDTDVTADSTPASLNWDDSSWSDSAWDDSSWSDSAWDDGQTAVDTNPLDEFERLDDVDVVAEVERLEQWDSGLATELEPATDGEVGLDGGAVIEVAFDRHQVNEEVESADDIMAASQATELTSEPDNSELARLLAKVQARLAAYE